jgi:Zn-dependent protease
MELSTILFYSIGVFLVLIILRYLLVAQTILGLVLEKPCAHLIERADCPGYLREFYEIKEKELLDLGFHFLYAHTIEDIIVKKHQLRYYFVYYHREKKAYASLAASPEAERAFPFWVSFSTYFKNEVSFPAFGEGENRADTGNGFKSLSKKRSSPLRAQTPEKLVTLNGIRHTIMSELPGAILQDAYTDTLEKQWEFHLETLAKMGPRDIRTFSETREGFREMLAHEDRSASQYIDQLEKKGLIFRHRENRYLVKTLASIVFAHQLLGGIGKFNTMKRRITEQEKAKRNPPELPVPLEVDNYENVQSLLYQKNRNTSGKIIFLVFTVILFVLTFGLLFSFELAFLLMVVIFIHEGGHLLAMSLLGYRDLRMLFVPLFGAVALGSDRDVPLYKKVITYFAGPVPGILLAFLILLILRSAHISLLLNPTLMMAVMVLLFINYFNLIPVMPLDGGQILNTLIFSRYPLLQFLFLVFSILALAFIALYLEAPLLLIFAFIVPFAYRNHWVQRKLVTRLRQQMKNREELSNNDILNETFTLLKENPYSHYPFQRKVQVVKYVEDNLEAAKPSRRTVVLTLVVYGAVFILPVVYFLVNFVLPLRSMQYTLFPSYQDPCAIVQKTDLPVNTAVKASRFQRVPSSPRQEVSFTCYRHCFYLGNSDQTYIPMAPAADFLSRLWARYGEPEQRDNSFLYTLKDTETGHVFTAYCQVLIPAYGGAAKSEEEKESLIPSLFLFEQLLRRTVPADCRLEMEIDFSGSVENGIDEIEFKEHPERYRSTYIMGSKNGTPYLEIKSLPGQEGEGEEL